MWPCASSPIVLHYIFVFHASGGVAALLCLLIKDSGGLPGLGPLRSITIGTAAVMSAPLAAACDEFTVSLILGADAVPHLSYASVEALLLEASEASPVRQVAQGLTKKLSSLGQFLGVGSGPLEATSTEAAIAATKEATEKRAGASGDGTGGSNSGKWSPVKSADMRLRESGAKPGFAEVRELARQTPRARQIPIIDLNEPGVQLPNETNGSEASAEQSKGAPGGRNGKEPMDGDDAPGSTTGTGGPGAPIGYVVEDSSAFSAGATDVLPYGFGPDAGLAAAAIAQEHSAPQTADAAQPGNPELLFPPGRLLWIFPAEESQEDDGGDEASGVEGGKLGSDVLDPEAERKLENAWDEAWEGRPSGGDAVNPAADSTAPVNADVPGAGAVNVAEATDAAARGEGGEGGSKARSVPAVVDADRATFERLLLLPDMLNDHLPDKYLEALKQL